MPSEPLSLEAIAYHEAGHAAVAFSMGRAIANISIIPGEEHLGNIRTPTLRPTRRVANVRRPDGSYVSNPRLNTPPRRTQRQAEGDLRFLLAGCAAQAIHERGKPTLDLAYAMAATVSALGILTGQGREGGDDHKARMVADELRGEIAVEAFIPGSMVLVVLAVSEAWPAVEAIAADLLARRRISGRRARQLYLEAGGPRLGRW